MHLLSELLFVGAAPLDRFVFKNSNWPCEFESFSSALSSAESDIRRLLGILTLRLASVMANVMEKRGQEDDGPSTPSKRHTGPQPSSDSVASEHSFDANDHAPSQSKAILLHLNISLSHNMISFLH